VQGGRSTRVRRCAARGDSLDRFTPRALLPSQALSRCLAHQKGNLAAAAAVPRGTAGELDHLSLPNYSELPRHTFQLHAVEGPQAVRFYVVLSFVFCLLSFVLWFSVLLSSVLCPLSSIFCLLSSVLCPQSSASVFVCISLHVVVCYGSLYTRSSCVRVRVACVVRYACVCVCVCVRVCVCVCRE
jgi:hypothetical protein